MEVLRNCCICSHFRMWKPKSSYCSQKKNEVNPFAENEHCWKLRKEKMPRSLLMATANIQIQSFKLSVDTEKRFNQLEKIIEKGMSHFVEVGTALTIIRDEKLYKDLFRNFEEYCKERWGFRHSYVNYLMGSTKVIEHLKTSTMVEVLPKTERETRPLTRLEPEQQKEAWKKAVETAPEGKVTAKHVEAVVYEMEGKEPREPEEQEEIEDTPVIKQLKKYWAMADAYEREIFINWIKEEETHD